MVKDIEKEVQNIEKWILEYVENAHADGVVVGNSGGKDSATVIALATKALGKDKVLTVGMPCESIKEDLNDARLVAKTFGVKMVEIDLTNTFKLLKNEINENIAIKISNEAEINIKPRLRMITLYGIAQTYGYLVLGTGNLCEAMVGYTTKWGDNAYDFNPIANFTVNEVLKIGEMLGVPDKIIHKAPNDGLGGKTDEEKMQIKYSEIAEYIENGKTDEKQMEKIEKKYLASMHKREKTPIYNFERRNYLKEKFEKKYNK